MAPSRKNSRKSRTLKKKQLDHDQSETADINSSLPAKSSENVDPLKKKDHEFDVGCTTPKAEKYKIPEILTCPPAPKKRKLVPSCSLRRSIAFFDPPDIELFFASHLAAIYRVQPHVR